MTPIPPQLRAHLAMLPRMKACALANGLFGDCEGRIEWEHAWIYANHQVQEEWAIIGLCHHHHAMKDGNRACKAAIQLSSLRLASDEDLAKYPRKNWTQERKNAEVLSTGAPDKPLAF